MPLIFIGATFWERLVFHHEAVNEADSCLLMRRACSRPKWCGCLVAWFLGSLGVILWCYSLPISSMQLINCIFCLTMAEASDPCKQEGWIKSMYTCIVCVRASLATWFLIIIIINNNCRNFTLAVEGNYKDALSRYLEVGGMTSNVFSFSVPYNAWDDQVGASMLS